MDYSYSVRGWLELSWPDRDVEGVDESAEEHAAKVQRVREALTARPAPRGPEWETASAAERCRAGWAFPQDNLEGTEYVLFGADVEEPATVLAQIREVLALDPFADGYFSLEGEDGAQYRQWLIKGGSIYTREALFPDFEAEGTPTGYALLPSS
jgi:hypothetical protein